MVAQTLSSSSPFRAAHSEALIDYLRDFTGNNVPQPAYVSNGHGSRDKWGEAIELCRGFLSDREKFDAEERDYKLKIAVKIKELFRAVEAGEPLVAPMADVLKMPPNNLLDWRNVAPLGKYVEDDPKGSRSALAGLLGSDSALARVQRFMERLPDEFLPQPGARLSVAGMLLMGLNPEEMPMYRAEPYWKVERVLGWPAASKRASLAEQYESHRAFTEELLSRVRSAGLDARDVLDAQSLIWMLATSKAPKAVAWRGGEPVEAEVEPDRVDRLDALAARLYLDRSFLEETIGLLEEKGQLIFYGPPGTGKTYIARHLARHLAGDEEHRVEVVQFHPSYSYEDFVQGYRPRLGADGGLIYELRPGPLVRLAEKARTEPDATFVLLVDEINRGNLPRIFGELLFLLEYRSERMRLMYSDDEEARFDLPQNLLVIGTMNTADRSIGLIDAALRRRFHFRALFPAEPPIQQVLPRWLAAHVPEMRHVAGLLDELNRRLRGRFGEHLQVGPSYFMRPHLDERLLEQIWQVDTLPFLEDQLFGHEDELGEFRLEAVRRQDTPGPISPADLEGVEDEDEDEDEDDGI